MQGQNNFMNLKLDLKKAYDRIKWSFIMETLEILQIPVNTSNFMKKCSSTTSMTINWNGATTNCFDVTRGPRNIYPIYAYLFVLNLE